MQGFEKKNLRGETFEELALLRSNELRRAGRAKPSASSEALCEGGSLGEGWCRGSELNQRREALQASALPLSYPGAITLLRQAQDKLRFWRWRAMTKIINVYSVWYLFVHFCQ